VLDDKGMIVCMSRRICIELNKEIVKLRPEWYHSDDDKGIIKVIMTGSASDDANWQEHVRTKPWRKAIGRFIHESASMSSPAAASAGNIV
jgi:type I restriction enzyme R subunit